MEQLNEERDERGKRGGRDRGVRRGRGEGKGRGEKISPPPTVISKSRCPCGANYE